MINISFIKHEDHINDYLNKEKVLEKTIIPHISPELKNNIINSIQAIDNHYINNKLFKNMKNVVIKVLGYIDHNNTSIDILLSLQRLESDKRGNQSILPITYAYLKIMSNSNHYDKSVIYYKSVMNSIYSSTVFFHNDDYNYLLIESQKTTRYTLSTVEETLDNNKTINVPCSFSDMINILGEKLLIQNLELIELGILILKQKRTNLSLENMLTLPTLEQYVLNLSKNTNNKNENEVNRAYNHALRLINTSYYNGVVNGNLSLDSVFSLDVFNPNPHYGDLLFDYAHYMVSVLSNDYNKDYNDYLSEVGKEVYSGLIKSFRFTYLSQEEGLEVTYERVLSWMYIIHTLKYSDNNNYSYLKSFLKSNVF